MNTNGHKFGILFDLRSLAFICGFKIEVGHTSEDGRQKTEVLVTKARE